jgi:hypothetical protein
MAWTKVRPSDAHAASPIRHLSLRLPAVGRVRVSHRPPRTAVDAGTSHRHRTPPAWIIFSPGALTGPADYDTLIGALTAAGAAVLTLDYDWPRLFAGEAPELGRATRAAELLLRGQLPARGIARHRLPPLPTRRRGSGPPLRILGYSLGAHVLSAAFQQDFRGRPVELVLLGASNLREPWRAPSPARIRVRVLAGSEDGVVDPAGLEALAAAFDTQVEWLAGVNHFGLLAPTVGAPEFRARDRATTLSQRACAEAIARQVLTRR